MAKLAKQLIPILNRVLVKKVEPVTQTKSGVVIPEDRKPKVTKGTVIAVGPGTTNNKGKNIPCCVKAGDIVLLPDYGGTRIRYGEGKNMQEYFLYREYDILAKINE